MTAMKSPRSSTQAILPLPLASSRQTAAINSKTDRTAGCREGALSHQLRVLDFPSPVLVVNFSHQLAVPPFSYMKKAGLTTSPAFFIHEKRARTTKYCTYGTHPRIAKFEHASPSAATGRGKISKNTNINETNEFVILTTM